MVLILFFFSSSLIQFSIYLDCAKKSSKKRVEKSNATSLSSENRESSESSENDSNEPPFKKTKSNSQAKLTTTIRSQNQEFHDLREKIKNCVGKEVQQIILKDNDQSVPRDKTDVNIL